MERMEWSSEFEIGDKEIDDEHRKYIDIINRLQDAFFSKEVIDTTDVQLSILKELLEFTKYHCSNEEKRMTEIQYPEAQKHWRLHKDFENSAYEKYRRLTRGDCVLNSELLAFIKGWLFEHVLKEDQKFVKYLQEKVH